MYRHVEIDGIKNPFSQDWNRIYEVARKEVYVPAMKDIFDCAHLLFDSEIKTRFNITVISISLEDIAEVLNVSFNEGEMKFQVSECMLAAFLHEQVQASCVLVQHVSPQVMACWSNKLCQ